MKQADTALVRRAAAGDRPAFAALIEAHWTPLVGLARSVVGDLTAEDAVQDALITAWKKLPSLRDPGAFSPWLSRVVVRQCLRRKRSWRDYVPLLPGAADAPDGSLSFSTRPDARIDLERCLRALAPRQRAVMYLTVVEGHTDGEIAQVLGISPASVRSHRRRARETLHAFETAVAPALERSPASRSESA